MKIYRETLDTCENASGLVVVIDVLRAFTTAAYAFDAGAEEIILVSRADEAFALKEEHPNLLLMGEVDGVPIEGFDLGNSPSALIGLDLSGKRLVHRSSAGTQGVVRVANANTILTASLCNVDATVDFIRKQNPKEITLVETGVFPGGWGEEDTACADLIEAMLLSEKYNIDEIKQRVMRSKSGGYYSDPNHSVFPKKDLECALSVNHFDFVMLVSRISRQLILKQHLQSS